jgi:hypothetical protein
MNSRPALRAFTLVVVLAPQLGACSGCSHAATDDSAVIVADAAPAAAAVATAPTTIPIEPAVNDAAALDAPAPDVDAAPTNVAAEWDGGPPKHPSIVRIGRGWEATGPDLAWLETPGVDFPLLQTEYQGPCAWFLDRHVPRVAQPKLVVDDPVEQEHYEQFQQIHVANLSAAIAFAQCTRDADGAWVLYVDQIEAASGRVDAREHDTYEFRLRVGRVEPEGNSYRLTLDSAFVPWPDADHVDRVVSTQFLSVRFLGLRPLKASELSAQDGGSPDPVAELTGSLYNHTCSPEGDPPPRLAKQHFIWRRGAVRWTPPPKVARPAHTGNTVL